MHSLTLLYDFGETKVQQRNFIAKGNKRKHRFLQVRQKNIKIDSFDLYAACKLAETYKTVSDLLKHFAIESLIGIIGPVGTTNIVVSGSVVAITISVSVLVATIAIIGILKDKKVKIKCNGYGMEGEIEIE